MTRYRIEIDFPNLVTVLASMQHDAARLRAAHPEGTFAYRHAHDMADQIELVRSSIISEAEIIQP
jgi:hypothetical protein